MGRKKIALFGGSFNPPHLNHRQIVEWLSGRFDEVVVMPCGYRQDKMITCDMPAHHRAALCNLAFSGLPNVRLDFSDLENASYTSSYALQQRYGGSDREVWHVVGSDLLVKGHSVIRTNWQHGPRIWHELNWLVVNRTGHEITTKTELPPHCRFESLCRSIGSSTEVRHRLHDQLSIDGMLQPIVEGYIRRYGLYLGRTVSAVTKLKLSSMRPYLQVDPYNKLAVSVAHRLQRHASPIEEASIVVALGGDGTLLRAVHEHWQRRRPFFGLNFGHSGFLLNRFSLRWNRDTTQLLAEVAETELTCYHLSLLLVEWIDDRGRQHTTYGFNDVYVKNADPSVAARMNVTAAVGHQIWKISDAIGDGLICATAAGSTGYAYQAGAEPLPLGGDGSWLVKGISTRQIPQVMLGRTSVVTCRLGNSYRQCVLCVDNRVLGPVIEFSVRLSSVAAAELLFLPGTDPAVKRIELAL